MFRWDDTSGFLYFRMISRARPIRVPYQYTRYAMCHRMPAPRIPIHFLVTSPE